MYSTERHKAYGEILEMHKSMGEIDSEQRAAIKGMAYDELKKYIKDSMPLMPSLVKEDACMLEENIKYLKKEIKLLEAKRVHRIKAYRLFLIWLTGAQRNTRLGQTPGLNPEMTDEGTADFWHGFVDAIEDKHKKAIKAEKEMNEMAGNVLEKLKDIYD